MTEFFTFTTEKLEILALISPFIQYSVRKVKSSNDALKVQGLIFIAAKMHQKKVDLV